MNEPPDDAPKVTYRQVRAAQELAKMRWPATVIFGIAALVCAYASLHASARDRPAFWLGVIGSVSYIVFLHIVWQVKVRHILGQAAQVPIPLPNVLESARAVRGVLWLAYVYWFGAAAALGSLLIPGMKEDGRNVLLAVFFGALSLIHFAIYRSLSRRSAATSTGTSTN